MGIGVTEWIIILVIVLVIFGGSRIPQLGDSLGKGIRNFKKSISGHDAVPVTPEKKELSEDGEKSAESSDSK